MYTKEETYRILNLEDTVTVVPAGGKFYDWDKEFYIIYKRPKSGIQLQKIIVFHLNTTMLKMCF